MADSTSRTSKRPGVLVPRLRARWPAVPVHCYLAARPMDLVVSSSISLVSRCPFCGSGDLPFQRSGIMLPTLQIWRPAVPVDLTSLAAR
ncbi:uncharacterized protein [Dermacentor albipictus]|uniref:uncharacterized protein isoform X3 n=1 Tax=Dermacentor albipictus TaxID=60249 RepID=UPI0038FC5CDD